MAIPKILHFTWKTDRLPRLFRRVLARWRETHPDWDIRVYTDADIRALVAERYPALLTTFDGYPAGIFRADAFRFFVLDAFGGVYSDLDVMPIGRIDRLLDLDCFVGAEPEQHVLENDAKYRGMPFLLCNAFMGSVAGHPFLKRCIEHLTSCACTDVIDATGPRFVNGMALTAPAEIRPRVLLPNYWSPLTNKGPRSHTSDAYADGLERHFVVLGRNEPPVVSHLWRNSWILPIGYKGPYVWRWPNRLHWATRRWRYPQMARLRVQAPTVDYDDQRLVPPNPLPRLFVGFDLADGDADAVSRWLERQTYPKAHLHVGLVGVTEELAAHINSLGYRTTRLPGDASETGFANVVLEGAGESDGAVIIGRRFRSAPDDAMQALVSARRPVVSGYSLDEQGVERNDRAFLYHADLFKYLYRHGGRDGRVRDVDSGNRLPLRHARALTIAPMTSVGADFLYVDGSVIADGIRFPPKPYKLHEDSTGFALLARERGFEICALPNLEVVVEQR